MTRSRNQSKSLAQNLYTDVGQQNAFQHAYLSAMLALRHSLTEAKLLGDAREAWTTYRYYSGQDRDYRTDTYRDLYNNAVGHAIGAYAKANGLTESDIAALVNHAVSSGQTIMSIRYSDPDPRLPYIDSYTDPNQFRLSPRPGLFNGWPGDFPNIPNIWTPPETRGSLEPGGILGGAVPATPQSTFP